MESVLTANWPADAGVSPRPKAARWAVKALFFMNGALFATWAARVPALQAAHGLSHGQLGMALLVMSLGAVLAMPTAGWLSARFGSDKVSKLAALPYCAMLPGLMLAPNLACFVVVLFCFGAFHGALDVAMNAQAVVVENQYARPIMSSFHALWSTGGLAGAAAGGLLAGMGLQPLTHFILAMLLFGGLALAAFPHLLRMDHKNPGTTAADAHGPAFRLPSRGLLALGVVALCVMVGEGAMADWSAVYLRSNLRANEGVAAAGYAVFSLAMAGGRFLGDRLSARTDAVTLVRVGSALAAGGLLAALIFEHTAVALAGFACVGMGFATIVPLVFSAAGRKPGIAPGIAVASVTTLGYLGFLLGPPVIGFASEFVGLRGALAIVVVTSLTAAVLAPTLGRSKEVSQPPSKP